MEAYLGHGSRVVVADRKIGFDQLRTLYKEAYRFIPRKLLR